MDKITITKDDARYVFVDYLFINSLIVMFLIVSLFTPSPLLQILSALALVLTCRHIYKIKKILVDDKLSDLGKWFLSTLWKRN